MQKDTQQNMQHAYNQGLDLAANLSRQFSFLNSPTSFTDNQPPPTIHPNILYGYAAGLSVAQNISRTTASFCQAEPLQPAAPPSNQQGAFDLPDGMLINFEHLKKAINQEIMQMLPPEHVVDEELLELSVEDQAEKHNYTKQQIEEFAQNLMETDLQFKMYAAMRHNPESALEDHQDIQLKPATLSLAIPGGMTLGLLGFAWLAYHNYIKDLKEYRATSIGDNILERLRVNIATDEANKDIASEARAIAQTKKSCGELVEMTTERQQAEHFTKEGAALFALIKGKHIFAYDYPQGVGAGTHFAIATLGKLISETCGLGWKFEWSINAKGKQVDYGTKDSRRLDMILVKDTTTPKEVYVGEVKTGNAIVTLFEAQRTLQRFNPSTHNVNMDQLNPGKPTVQIIKDNKITIGAPV